MAPSENNRRATCYQLTAAGRVSLRAHTARGTLSAGAVFQVLRTS